MASNLYTQAYANGTKRLIRRSTKQGRKSLGLAKPELVRLYSEDDSKLIALSEKFGHYWNRNDFIRNAVHSQLSNSVYIELLKP